MTAARPADILRLLEPPGAPDGDLLALFARTRDAAAFAELVRRHGPLVLGVCRRVTGNVHDAEDAFQASFLVLAQKAGSLTNAALVGNWLYGVAFRVARRAQRAAARRRAREVTVPTMPDPPAPDARAAVPELGPILDEELAALAEHHRDAIVLCDLRGLSREAAAEALGVPEGTLSSRLANGRKKLAARLARRGVALPAAGLSAALGSATASVPAELLARTCETVTDWAATGTAPAALAALTKGGFAMRLSLLFGSVLVLGITGAVFASRPASEPPVPPNPPVLASADDKKPEAKADAKAAAKPALGAPRLVRAIDERLVQLIELKWNVKGTHLAVQGYEDQKGEFTRVSLFALDATVSPIFGARWGAEQLVAVTPDGTAAVTLLRERNLISGNHRLTFLTPKAIAPLAGGAVGDARALESEHTIKLEPSRAWQHVFAADLKSFRMLAPVDTPDGDKSSWEVLEVSTETGATGKRLLELPEGAVSLSPDGRLATHVAPGANGFAVHDVDGAKKLFEFGLKAGLDRTTDRLPPVATFAPNGRLLFATHGIGSAVLLDVNTGEPARELEGLVNREPVVGQPPVVVSEALPGSAAFTSDGRLLAALVKRYKITAVAVKRGGFPPAQPGETERREYANAGTALVVWDTETGKVLKAWPAGGSVRVAFNPVRPLLAVAEQNGEKNVRVGFWDFAAEVKK